MKNCIIKRQIICFFIFFLFLTQILSTNSNTIQKTDLLDGSWIDSIDDIKIVFLNGSFYNMGYQLGTLLYEEILISIRAHIEGVEEFGITLQDFERLWNIQKPYISDKTLQYLQGTADAINKPLKDIGFIWIWEGVFYEKRCTSFALWGDATETGELIHVRSLDSLGYLKDPITETYIQEYPIIVVCNPDNDHAFLYPTIAGYSVEDGFNSKGISVCNLWSVNSDGSSEGSPMGVRLFEALYKADDAENAIQIITSNKTFGYNFVICDAKIPEAYAVETTKNLTYIGTWDHPSENTYPFFEMKHVIRRANCYIDPTLSETQREIYNPRSLRYLINLRENYGWINSWLRYKGMSKAIQNQYGTIDSQDALDIIRNLYNGSYNLFWWLLTRRSDIFSEWQWSATPSTGDIYFSFIKKDSVAYKNQIYHLNLFELLEN
jgi:hypothetical protein